MFTKEDVKGALINIKEEVAHLKNAHSRVMQHFKGLDLNDLETCVLALSDEDQRQTFQTDFQKFARQMDIILPDATALPFLGDLKLLGKISLGARNLYRDSQLNISGVGEKVRQLIEDHIYATGVDPKIPPVDLLSVDFEKKLNEHKSSKAKASEVQHAIKHHINVNLEEDPEYYKKLSERLDEIIKKSGEKWEDLLQMLLDFRANIEPEHQKKAQDLGLSSTEFAFHNILMAGIAKKYGDPIPEDLHDQVIEVVKKLVLMIQEATDIIGFFEKWNEVQRVQKEIRRTILAQDFGSDELVKDVTDGFLELAKVKFK
jgi:type I restriction enzyme R subunit